jgi:hypothetical protein
MEVNKLAKYRKKPVVIEAIQFRRDNAADIQEFTGFIVSVGLDETGHVSEMIIPTLEGDMRASIGDYIIKGVNGEFYPCKPDIFEKTYELVE